MGRREHVLQRGRTEGGRESGELHRRRPNFARLLALVVDDAQPDDLTATPSWVLQTSPGKCQVGFLLTDDDPDCANQPLVEALVTSLVKRGLIGGDKAGDNTVRYVRLPVGTNGKQRETGPFKTYLSDWFPHIRYSLEDAAAAIGIDLDLVRIQLNRGPVNTTGTGLVSGPQDEKLKQLMMNILVGENLHDSINELAASLVASGTRGGTVTNQLRALMEISSAHRDKRWHDRFRRTSLEPCQQRGEVRAAAIAGVAW